MNKMFWQGKKVLITGANGFIGSSFRQALKLCGAFVFDVSANEKFDVIIHCAAIDGNAKFKLENQDKIFNGNLALASDVLAIAKTSSACDLILMSSMEVYAALNNSNSSEKPSLYSSVKLEIEKLFQDFAKNNDKRLMIVRSSNVYGPNEHRADDLERVIPAMIRKAFCNEPIEIWGNGEEKRNFLHIEDLVNGVLFQSEKGNFNILNLSGPKAISIKKLAKMIIALTKSNSKIVFKNNNSVSNYLLNQKGIKTPSGFKSRSLKAGLKSVIAKRNLLVALADKNFITQAKQLFSSVYNNAGWKGDYMLLAYNLEESDKAWFKERGILIFDCPSWQDLSGAQKYPAVTLSKLFLFQTYFKRWRHVVFLDSDVIVRTSLDGLLSCHDFSAPKATYIKLKDEFVIGKDDEHLFKQYDLESSAFCSGVFVIETKMIENDTFSKLKDVNQKFGHFGVFGEEPSLNLYFYKNWNELAPEYHGIPWFFKEQYKIPEKKVKARIFHFLCRDKPWDKTSYYFSEWSNNLEAANNINLWQIKKAKPFRGKYYFLFYLYCRKNVRKIDVKKIWRIFEKIDASIGRFGMVIEKKAPGIYRFISIKKFKKLLWPK